jgi:tRNA(Ile)-lysidine synthase
MVVASRPVVPLQASNYAAPDPVDAAALALVRACDPSSQHLALAVSGGCDSMVLMHAVQRALVADGRDRSRVRVLTFDHGTGRHARAAAALVEAEGSRLGFDVRTGRAGLPDASEAEWRAARWRFLRAAADSALIATAHTRDDQVETVAMRVTRAAGARGLAGLAAPAPGILRPFLDVDRERIRQFAREHGVPFLEDPSNISRAHFRNRVRLDLLPAIRQVRPRFGDELLALARRAAAFRAEVDAIAATFVLDEADDGCLRVARRELATYDSTALCVLWPAIAARASVTLDRRGTLRLAQFTTSGEPGARIQLSGGVEVYRHRDSFVLRRVARPSPVAPVTLVGVVQFGEWRFRPVGVTALPASDDSAAETTGAHPRVDRIDRIDRLDRDDPWTFDLPGDRPLSIRAWQPADRMRPRPGGTARRVKRFFGDAKVAGPSRAGWPVVLAGDEIVWIPGVRRGAAAPERSGRPVVRYACERFRGELPNR